MRHFIQALKSPLSKLSGKPITPFEYSLDTETYTIIFAKAIESTASSPSGLHYVHYIADLQDNTLTLVNDMFIRGPFMHGFSLERWSSSVQCMLQKKNKLFITKFRIIELFEADLNSGLKYILGRKLLYHGEEHGIKRIETQTITKLTYDIARLDKVTMVYIFNDAEGCYDRMIHNLMTITAERMGCTNEVVLCHTMVLNQTKHFIQTVVGISEAFIRACKRLNIGGI